MPSMASLERIAKALGVSEDVLLKSGEDDGSNVVVVQEGGQRVRVLEWRDLGVAIIPSKLPDTGDLYDSLLVDMNISEGSFALRLRGDSMEPTFRQGDIVIVDPQLQPRPGDCVLAIDGAGEHTFKQYRDLGIDQAGNRTFELQPLNSLYPSRRSDREHLEIVATMVEHRRRRPDPLL